MISGKKVKMVASLCSISVSFFCRPFTEMIYARKAEADKKKSLKSK